MKKLSNLKVIILQLISFVCVLFLASFLFSESSCSRTQTSETKSVVSELNNSKFEKIKDQENAVFLVAAAEIYLREIKLSQLVQGKASQVDVKELGRMNEEFHTTKLVSLIKLAKSKSISIPTSPNIWDEEMYAHLAKQSGDAFDKGYCDEMVSNQNKSINFFEKISKESSDSDIKEWALRNLPAMKRQHSYAVTCQKKFARTVTF